MLPAVLFYEVILALHIAAVVVAFGVTFAYPIIFAVIGRQDPRALGALHRAELAVSQRLIMPGLAVVIVAGLLILRRRRSDREPGSAGTGSTTPSPPSSSASTTS